MFVFIFFFFFFNDTATTEIYTLSLHDALPISDPRAGRRCRRRRSCCPRWSRRRAGRTNRRPAESRRSEEHTSELQSLAYLVCRLLLEKKKKIKKTHIAHYKTRVCLDCCASSVQ